MLVLASAPFDTNDAKFVPTLGPARIARSAQATTDALSRCEAKGHLHSADCDHAKINRAIDVTLEELKASNTEAVRIASEYGRNN